MEKRMLEKKDEKVLISKELWEELKNDKYFHEVIELIEDREDLETAQKETTSYIDYSEYRKKRLDRIDV